MPKLSDAQIFARIQKAMQPPAQAQQGFAPQTMEALIQKAKAKRGAAPAVTPKARGM